MHKLYLTLFSVLIVCSACSGPTEIPLVIQDNSKYFDENPFTAPTEEDIAEIRDILQDETLEVLTLNFEHELILRAGEYQNGPLESRWRTDTHCYFMDINGLIWVVDNDLQLVQCVSKFRKRVRREKFKFGFYANENHILVVSMRTLTVIRDSEDLEQIRNKKEVRSLTGLGDKYYEYNYGDNLKVRTQMLRVYDSDFEFIGKTIDNPYYVEEAGLAVDHDVHLISFGNRLLLYNNYSDQFMFFDGESVTKKRLNIPGFREKAEQGKQETVQAVKEERPAETNSLFAGLTGYKKDGKEYLIIAFNMKRRVVLAEYDLESEKVTKALCARYSGRYMFTSGKAPYMTSKGILVPIYIDNIIDEEKINADVLFTITHEELPEDSQLN